VKAKKLAHTGNVGKTTCNQEPCEGKSFTCGFKGEVRGIVASIGFAENLKAIF
jgi:hypothetical protein